MKKWNEVYYVFTESGGRCKLGKMHWLKFLITKLCFAFYSEVDGIKSFEYVSPKNVIVESEV